MPDWRKWVGRLKKHKVHTPPETPTPTGGLSTTVGNGLNVALRLLKEAVTGIGVPGLEPAVNGIVCVIDLIKDVRDNANDLGDLDSLISSLTKTISDSPDLHRKEDVTESLRLRVDAFLSELHGMLTEVQGMLGDKNVASRTANSRAHKDAIGDINSRINRLLSRFSAEGILAIELNVAGVRQDIQSVGKAVAVNQEHLVGSQLAQEYETLINSIPRVHARYNDTSTKPSRPCHPGTRTGLLRIIRKWIEEDPDATPYFWLCGEVGVGKSTVAHTIAQEQEALAQLGACFFFSRHDDNRRKPHLLFTSIAYQLARFDKGFFEALAEALKPNPDIVKRTPMEQFKQLVLEPLTRSGIDPSRTVLIVIDGLDECSDPASILDVLAQGIDKVGIRLRVLISSRPYADILSKFKGRRLYHLTSETQFRNIDPQSLSDDIAAYLSWSLGAVALESDLPSPWPPQEQLDELIRRAAGLFIIASTYTKYIENPAVGNPVDQLARILSRKKRIGSSPLAELDDLYDQVLDDLRSRLSSDVEIARDTLAIIIHGRGDINIQLLVGLLCVDPSDVRLILRHLTAVIPLPDRDDDAIVPFHASFGEYIQDPTRCTIRGLLVDAEVSYGRIAVLCSDVIAFAAKDGLIGVEYDSVAGVSWEPKHWAHIGEHLAFYLSKCLPAQAEEAKATLIGNRIWLLLNVMVLQLTASNILRQIDEANLFKHLLPIEGSSDDERVVSLATLMIANHASEINSMARYAVTIREAVTVDVSEHGQRQTLEFMVNLEGNDLDRALESVQTVRCWAKYTHSNVLLILGIDIGLNDNKLWHEILVFVAWPIMIQNASSLSEHLKRTDDLALVSRVRTALGVADGLRYLHGSTPPQPHNGINPHQIIVSSEGQPVLYPSEWRLDTQSTSPPNERNDIEKIPCHYQWNFSPPGWYHWVPTERGWQGSLKARLQVDVWDFGSILYQMITGEEPLAVYNRLAEGNETMGYDAEEGKVPDEYWSVHVDLRHEAAASILLDTLQASEDVKGLLKSCWAIQPEARPPMSEVYERLKGIVEAVEM